MASADADRLRPAGSPLQVRDVRCCPHHVPAGGRGSPVSPPSWPAAEGRAPCPAAGPRGLLRGSTCARAAQALLRVLCPFPSSSVVPGQLLQFPRARPGPLCCGGLLGSLARSFPAPVPSRSWDPGVSAPSDTGLIRRVADRCPVLLKVSRFLQVVRERALQAPLSLRVMGDAVPAPSNSSVRVGTGRAGPRGSAFWLIWRKHRALPYS